jgi:hypothetical protein
MNRLNRTCRNGHTGTARNSDGRFALGNAGGPGRPRRATEKEYLAALTEVCSVEQWRLICRRAVADAKRGDPAARSWIAKYLLGPPGELPTLWAIAEAMKAEEGARS